MDHLQQRGGVYLSPLVVPHTKDKGDLCHCQGTSTRCESKRSVVIEYTIVVYLSQNTVCLPIKYFIKNVKHFYFSNCTFNFYLILFKNKCGLSWTRTPSSSICAFQPLSIDYPNKRSGPFTNVCGQHLQKMIYCLRCFTLVLHRRLNSD